MAEIGSLHPFHNAIEHGWPNELVVEEHSPAGMANRFGNHWLQPGDLIAGEIAGIGTLRNRCVAPERAA